jgi:hypothetical protein
MQVDRYEKISFKRKLTHAICKVLLRKKSKAQEMPSEH